MGKKRVGSQVDSGLSHADLVEAGRQWLLKPRRKRGLAGNRSRGPCSLVLTEIVTSISEVPDVIGWCRRQSIVLEAKATRSDFYSDRRKPFRIRADAGLGCLRYYIVPKDLVKPEELSEGWGLIEVSGTKTRVTRESQTFEANRANEVAVLLSLIRRLRIEPGRHVSVMAYSQQVSDPKATVTTVEQEDLEKRFESGSKAIAYLQSSDDPELIGVKVIDGYWYPWTKDETRYHSGFIRLGGKGGLIIPVWAPVEPPKEKKFEIWATQGQGEYRVAEFPTLQAALKEVRDLEGQASFGIKLPNGEWYSWDGDEEG